MPDSRAMAIRNHRWSRSFSTRRCPASIVYKNFVLDKGKLQDVVGDCYRELGPAKTAQVADDIKRLGFQYATKSGTTIAIDDVTIPEEKYAIIAEVQK